MIKNMDMVTIPGQMENHMMVAGSMANSMVKPNLQIQKVRRELDNGKMVIVLSGLKMMDKHLI